MSYKTLGPNMQRLINTSFPFIEGNPSFLLRKTFFYEGIG